MKNTLIHGFQWGQTIAIPIYTVLPYCVIIWNHFLRYYTYLTSQINQFLHTSCFSCALYPDIIKSKISFKLKVKMKNTLIHGFQWGQTITIPIYTVLPYCVIVQVVSESWQTLLPQPYLILAAYSNKEVTNEMYIDYAVRAVYCCMPLSPVLRDMYCTTFNPSILTYILQRFVFIGLWHENLILVFLSGGASGRIPDDNLQSFRECWPSGGMCLAG